MVLSLALSRSISPPTTTCHTGTRSLFLSLTLFPHPPHNIPYGHPEATWQEVTRAAPFSLLLCLARARALNLSFSFSSLPPHSWQRTIRTSSSNVASSDIGCASVPLPLARTLSIARARSSPPHNNVPHRLPQATWRARPKAAPPSLARTHAFSLSLCFSFSRSPLPLNDNIPSGHPRATWRARTWAAHHQQQVTETEYRWGAGSCPHVSKVKSLLHLLNKRTIEPTFFEWEFRRHVQKKRISAARCRDKVSVSRLEAGQISEKPVLRSLYTVHWGATDFWESLPGRKMRLFFFEFAAPCLFFTELF